MIDVLPRPVGMSQRSGKLPSTIRSYSEDCQGNGWFSVNAWKRVSKRDRSSSRICDSVNDSDRASMVMFVGNVLLS